MQNTLFAAFEQLLDARIEAAIAGGTYDIGVETLTAESFRIAERRTVYTHAATGAETRCYRVLRKDRNRPLPLAEALALRADGGRLLINEQTQRAAVQMHAASLMDDDGKVEIRTRLIRPMARETISVERSITRTGARRRARNFPRCGKPNARASRNSPRARFTSSPACCCRSGTGCRPQNMRVYRFETDDGERVIGRLVTPEALDASTQASASSGAPAALSHDGGLERCPRPRRGARSRRRFADPPLAGHGRASRRADRLLRRRRAAIEGARPHLGDYRLAPAALRADRGRSRPGDPRRTSSTAIRFSRASARAAA